MDILKLMTYSASHTSTYVDIMLHRETGWNICFSTPCNLLYSYTFFQSVSQHSKLNISFYSCSLNIDTRWSSLLLYFFLKCVTTLKFQRIVLAKIDWVLLRCSIILSSDCRPTGTTDLGKFKILHFPKKLQLFSFYF